MFGDALVRLGSTLDPVLLFITLGGEKANHLIGAAGALTAEQAGDDVNVVADAELVGQENLRTEQITFGRSNGARKARDEGLVIKA